VNHEEQYFRWPADRENPLGWKDVGKSGPKSEFPHKGSLDGYEPLSLGKKMQTGQGNANGLGE